MNFIKKIFDGKIDLLTHNQFQKFSKGEFRDRAQIKVKVSSGKYTLSTGHEFANEMVKSIAEKLGNEKTNVIGAIISTSDLKKDIDFKKIKQFQGIKQYLIESQFSGKEIIDLLNRFPKAFFALSFSTSKGDILKIKAKSPKSGKSGSGENKKFAPDFCKLITNDSEIAKSFVFEKENFKLAEITHKFILTGLEIPEELKKSEDFAKIREESKRVGRIIREATIDGEKIKSEKNFVA